VTIKVLQYFEPIVKPPRKHALIIKISKNPDLAELEIHKTRDENRNLCCQIARVVLIEAMEKDGAILPGGIAGNQVRQVVGIIDGPISEALQSSAALPELDLWRIHTKHVSKVCNNGQKSYGCQTYHPMLMNWAIAFFACTSASPYKAVAKMMMMPHISTVYRKIVKLITTKNNKPYCLHMNTILGIGDQARQENWTSQQQIGVIAQDSANINAGIEHDYFTNTREAMNRTALLLSHGCFMYWHRR
jgi:hypothetical protein